MRCTDDSGPAADRRDRGRRFRVTGCLAWLVCAALAGCAAPGPVRDGPAEFGAPTAARGAPAVPAPAGNGSPSEADPGSGSSGMFAGSSEGARSGPATGVRGGAGGPTPQARHVLLAAPATPQSAVELRQQFARRLVTAHPDSSFLGPAPQRLFAIPVIEVELNADGSVRHIDVLRRPTTGDEATSLAIAAIRRAAPYGNVSRLPRPWKLVEVFLFDDDLRFKPQSLDID